MSKIQTRAPGKLFLLGEYAVLFGGPAIVMAVDRYVSVTLESAETFTLRSPGAGLPDLDGKWESDCIRWRGDISKHGLLVELFEVMTEQGILKPNSEPFALNIDSTELFDGGLKLGLGSSAAVVNAVADAINRWSSSPLDPDKLLALIHDVHRSFQSGRGSGADVAASWQGGVIDFQRIFGRCLPLVRPVDWPCELHAGFIWLGKPTSTTGVLQSLKDFQTRQPGQFSEAFNPLLQLANTGRDAFVSGDASGFVDACRAYCHNLSEFGRIVGVDIVSQAHAQLADMAGKMGVAYKPSGAGGGDFGVALSTNINDLRSFCDQFQGPGAAILPLSIAPGKQAIH